MGRLWQLPPPPLPQRRTAPDLKRHLRVQLVSRSWSRTVLKVVKSCTRMTLFRLGELAVAFSSRSLTELPMPSTTIFVCLPPDVMPFNCLASFCNNRQSLYSTGISVPANTGSRRTCSAAATKQHGRPQAGARGCMCILWILTYKIVCNVVLLQ